MNAYIGPDRREGLSDRRLLTERDSRNWQAGRGAIERRGEATVDRRQEGLAGVISGLNGEDMQLLVAFWRGVENEREHSARDRDAEQDIIDKYTDREDATDAVAAEERTGY